MLLIAQWHHVLQPNCGFGDPVMWQNFVLQAAHAVAFYNACVVGL